MDTEKDIYYKGNCEICPITITFKTNYCNMAYELPWDADAEAILNAVYSAMIGMTFSADGILDAMQEFVDSHKNSEEDNIN